MDEKYIYSALGQQGVIEHMMNEYHFNPEIFKRFTPILQNYCKIKSLSMKNINNLFKYIFLTQIDSKSSLIGGGCDLRDYLYVG